MSAASRERLARIVREPGCDLVEAALLVCVEVEPDLDVEVELLRVDALADGLRTSSAPTSDVRGAALELSAYLAGTLGFDGDTTSYHDPRNSLLTSVLDRRRGLPITLSILYVGIARRVGVRAFGINTPGHFLTGVSGDDELVVVDPFHGGAILDTSAVAARVEDATGGRVRFTRSMLRPAAAPLVIHRLLNNLTRDFINDGDAEDALWTVELRALLPGSDGSELRAAGELLVQLGRYREAARAFDAYVARTPRADDATEVSHLALRARAKMN